MKSKFIILFVSALIVSSLSSTFAEKKNNHQIEPNFTVGYDIKLSDNYTGRNFHLGAALTDKFENNSRAYWKVGADLNWNKYYLNDAESLFGDNSVLRTNSFSIPIEFGYEIKRSFLVRTHVFAGPVYDYIFAAKLNGNYYDNFDRGLLGLKVGVKFNVIRLINFKISYSTFPDYMINSGFNRSSLSLSMGI